MPSIEFTKIFILESLKQSDFKSGYELKQALNGYSAEGIHVPHIDYQEVDDYHTFKNAIQELTLKSSLHNDKFILHIECHGNQDGIFLKNDDFISWHELSCLLVELNKAMGFNLLLCIGGCYGGYALQMVKCFKPSPCMAIAGPSDEVFPDELLNRYRSFYRELLTNLNLVGAFRRLSDRPLCNGGFLCQTADVWFKKQILDNVGLFEDADIIDARVEDIFEKIPLEHRSFITKDIIKNAVGNDAYKRKTSYLNTWYNKRV
jgi:hypothetical protein